jgi:hypothetical protein
VRNAPSFRGLGDERTSQTLHKNSIPIVLWLFGCNSGLIVLIAEPGQVKTIPLHRQVERRLADIDAASFFVDEILHVSPLALGAVIPHHLEGASL